MQTGHHFLPEFRHATLPTYFVSFVFPLLLAGYEVYRIGHWVVQHGWHFAQLPQAGYEFTPMLIVFALQVILDGLFFITAWAGKRPDVAHRLANLTLGVLCSVLVIAFDIALQVAAF